MSKGVNKNGALVIIPPKDHWKIIQKIRRKYDKTYLKWPPHINLIWPFVFAEDFYRNFGKLGRKRNKITPKGINENICRRRMCER